MELKEGVNPQAIRPELLLALIVADSAYQEIGTELVVTSLNDSKHSETSLHYSGQAADLRIWHVIDVEALAARIRAKLGNNPDYDVVVEHTHIHLEYQPKRKA